VVTSFTFVKKQAHLSDDEFFERWVQHTREHDLRDHPEISLNRLMMITDGSGFVGIAENHWPDVESLQAAAAFYETEVGQRHWADLESFMDIANSPTVVVTAEADVSADLGARILLAPSGG
jgi:hypothetical protein